MPEDVTRDATSCSRSRPGLFAEKGFKNTTVRDIADAAGILSGSLYHHFDSKESMVDEILQTFQDELFGQYDEILASDADARTKIERAVRLSFEAIDQHPHEVAIFQNEADYLGALRPVRLPRRAQRPVARGLDDAADRGRRGRRAARRPRHRAHLPLHPRHRLGRGPVVPPRRRPAPTPRSPTSTSPSSWTGSQSCAEAYIVDAVRTPVGKRGGALAGVHSADLAAHTLAALVRRTGVDPGAVDDVILGCCDTIGSQAGDVARTAWLVAGLPDHVPGVTIDRQCGSSQQAVHFAAQGVMSGTQDLVVAGGVQNMSAIPISAAMLVGQQYGFSTPFAESPGWQARYGDQEVSQFRSAEMIAEKWDISREDMEAFALASHDRARAAIAEGRFKDEIEPVTLPDGTVFDTDQCPRETSLEKMAGLEPLAPGGRITAAVARRRSATRRPRC